MSFTIVILTAMLCLNAGAESNIDGRSDDAIVAAAEQLLAESDAPAAAAAAVVEAKKELKESEIPVLLEPKKAAKSGSSMIWRLVASLAIIAAVAGIMIFASKKWGRRADKGGKTARIEILHQHHLGPRRSIALIRVAGETMLLGVTDQNVNMLKAITLIDEELEGAMTKDFNGFLEDEFSIEDVRNAINPRA